MGVTLADKMPGRVLIMGGSGFIGQNVAKHLSQSGYSVGIYATSEKPEHIEGEYYSRNLLEDHELTAILKNYRTVVYLVSSTSPQTSMSNPERVYQDDLSMLVKTLEACRKCDISRVVFASSGGTIYGKSFVPNKEDAPVFPVCHYAIGKLAAEKILNLYNSLYGMECISLRISNPFGFGQSPISGVGAITAFAERIAKGESVLLIGSKDNVRDFIGVEYVAQAFQQAIEWSFDKSIEPVFNIGSGFRLSIGEAIEMISKAVGATVVIEEESARPCDVPCSILDVSKAQQYLGYVPPRDPTSEIIDYACRVKEHIERERFVHDQTR